MDELYAIVRDGKIIWAGVVDAGRAQDVATIAAVNNGMVSLLSGEDLGVHLLQGRGASITRGQLEEWVGHALTDEQVEAIDECIPNSSIPEAIATIALEALGIVGPDEEEN